MSETQRTLVVPVGERDHVRGNADAPVTLVEYGDYECPTCGASHPVVLRLLEALPAEVKFVFRHFPQSSIHPHAGSAAQAAEAAGAQGKFWAMHDLLFEHQHDLEPGDLNHYALKVGLEPYQFAADLSTARFARRVKNDFEGGQRSGVRGTPTYFINGVRYEGENAFEALAGAIRRAR